MADDPEGPLAGRHTTGAWTGTELIIVGGRSTDGPFFRDAAAYNPITRTWRRVPSLPEPRAGATATWTGREVLVVGGYGPANDVRNRWYADGVAYNPAVPTAQLPWAGRADRPDRPGPLPSGPGW